MDSYVHPYIETDDDTTTDTESAVTTDSEESQAHDGQMQALDQWRAQAQSWITAPGRQPVSSTILEHEPEPEGDLADLPLEIRAKDIRRHVINVDSRFRENVETEPATNFYYRLLTTIKNVTRVRIASIEFPNNYPFFTAIRKNVMIQITKAGVDYDLILEDGNYTAADFITSLSTFVTGIPALAGLTVTFSAVTGKFTFTAPYAFSIDTTVDSYDRPLCYGLGYYLGFSRGLFQSAPVGAGPTQYIKSNLCANFSGDSYVFLRLNGFECVRQTTGDNDFGALAKIVIRSPKNYMSFDDGGNKLLKEIVFQNPQDLTRFQVQILDPFGEIMDICSSEISFSIEVLEITNHHLAERIRDSMIIRYV